MYIFLIYYKKTIESNIYDLLDEFRECSLTDKIWFYIAATVNGSHIYNCYYFSIFYIGLWSSSSNYS